MTPNGFINVAGFISGPLVGAIGLGIVYTCGWVGGVDDLAGAAPVSFAGAGGVTFGGGDGGLVDPLVVAWGGLGVIGGFAGVIGGFAGVIDGFSGVIDGVCGVLTGAIGGLEIIGAWGVLVGGGIGCLLRIVGLGGETGDLFIDEEPVVDNL